MSKSDRRSTVPFSHEEKNNNLNNNVSEEDKGESAIVVLRDVTVVMQQFYDVSGAPWLEPLLTRSKKVLEKNRG